ncbi:MAG: dTMP kinase [Anaerolineales bacterium]|nr:dTMP kinase [Anaerolineales bacterium]
MFITLEGPEGSGKTSHIPPLVDFLRQRGLTVIPTREPGGTSIGEQIRTILHDLKNSEMNPRTEILLFQASRSQIVEEVIKPHLAAGEIVLCDRYGDSTMAYQGYGHALFDLDELGRLIRFATGGLVPDLTILLDVDVEVGLQRKNSSGEWNRLDAYRLEFHQRVRQGYLQMMKAEPGRWVLVDAGQSWEKVQVQIRGVILERLDMIHR